MVIPRGPGDMAEGAAGIIYWLKGVSLMCDTLKDKQDSACTTNSRIIDNTDFIAEFKEGRWVVKWKWKSPPLDVPKKG